MRLKLRQLRLRSVTSAGVFSADVSFQNGLTVLWADNSMGKSTCIQGIIYALGLERMLGPHHEVPLTPAMTRTIEDWEGGQVEHPVLESDVFLEIENDKGDALTIQRSAVGTRDRKLISTWDGPALTEPEGKFPQRDFFAADPGSATREAGFHKRLADFVGWNLPTVTRFSGQDCPLYMECIFPLMLVEQKHGWTGIQGNLPTFLGIREMGKRAIEFICSLDAYNVAVTRLQIEQEVEAMQERWKAHHYAFRSLLLRAGIRVVGVPASPVSSWPPEIKPHLETSRGDVWLTVEQALQDAKKTLEHLAAVETPTVQQASQALDRDLIESRDQLNKVESALNQSLDAGRADAAQLTAIEQRLEALREDLRKNKDIAKLRHLGSIQDLTVSSGHCPTCSQPIPDSLLSTGAAENPMSLDENINFIESQIGVFDAMRANTLAVIEARAIEGQSFNRKAAELRAKIRAIRQALVSPSATPSVAAIRERLLVEDRIKSYEDASHRFTVWMEETGELAAQWRDLQERKARLPSGGLSSGDVRKLSKLQTSFIEQLKEYGLASIKPDSISIDHGTYRPTREGFNLGFDLSASDNIRTIWAYLTALLELARDETTSHLGLLILDGPRQQETARISFKEFLRRSALASGHQQQVIFATGDPLEELKADLAGIPHSLVSFTGKVLKKQQPA